MSEFVALFFLLRYPCQLGWPGYRVTGPPPLYARTHIQQVYTIIENSNNYLIWIRLTEECIGKEVCTSIARSIEPLVDPKDCQTHFKCDISYENSNIDNNWERHGEARALSTSSIKRIIQTKSIRRPKDWYKSKYCQKCERKRSKCFYVRIYLKLLP